MNYVEGYVHNFERDEIPSEFQEIKFAIDGALNNELSVYEDFVVAMQRLDFSHLEDLLHYGANINASNKKFETYLITAIEIGNHGLIKFLLENGADPNQRGAKPKKLDDYSPHLRWIATPLEHVAIAKFKELDVDLVRILLNFGAEVTPTILSRDNLPDELYKEIIDSLILSGDTSAIYWEDEKGVSPLVNIAGGYKCRNKLKMLLDINPTSLKQETISMHKSAALSATVNRSYFQRTRLLLNAGANPNVLVKNEFHSVLYKAINNYQNILCRLINGELTPRAKEAFNLIKILCKHGADPTLVDEIGYSPLSWITTSHSKDLFNKILLETNKEILISNDNVDTALAIAAFKFERNIECVQFHAEEAKEEKITLRDHELRFEKLKLSYPTRKNINEDYLNAIGPLALIDTMARGLPIGGEEINNIVDQLADNIVAYTKRSGKGAWSRINKKMDEFSLQDCRNFADMVREYVNYVELPVLLSPKLWNGSSEPNLKEALLILKERIPETANYLINSMLPWDLLQLSRIWHDNHELLLSQIREYTPNGNWWEIMDETLTLKSKKVNGWSVQNIGTSIELDEFGSEIRTCVSSYWANFMTAEQHLFVFRDEKGKARSYIRTELSNENGQSSYPIYGSKQNLNILYFSMEANNTDIKEKEKLAFNEFVKQVRTGKTKINTCRTGEKLIDNQGDIITPLMGMLGSKPSIEAGQRAFDIFAANTHSLLRIRKSGTARGRANKAVYIVPFEDRKKPIQEIISKKLSITLI